MLKLRNAFYEWLVKNNTPNDKCEQIQKSIDNICKEITKNELNLIHRIVEEKDTEIDFCYVLSKYHFFANIKRKSHINQNNEIVSISWEELAAELPFIILGYEGRKKTTLQKYNEFLFETKLPGEIQNARGYNFHYIVSLIKDEYFTTSQLAYELGLSERTIKEWRANRIEQHKEDQLYENEQIPPNIGPRFKILGGNYIYDKKDVKEYIEHLPRILNRKKKNN